MKALSTRFSAIFVLKKCFSNQVKISRIKGEVGDVVNILNSIFIAILFFAFPGFRGMAACTLDAEKACCCAPPVENPFDAGCCSGDAPQPVGPSADSHHCGCMFQPYDGMLPAPVLTLHDTSETNLLPNFRPAGMRVPGIHSRKVRLPSGEVRPPGRAVPLFLAKQSYLI